MRVKAREVFLLLVALAIFGYFFRSAEAEPYGPEAITVESSDRGNLSYIGAQTVYAQAGNVTQLTINATMITRYWQGYYGNISGRITLDDAAGNTMYNWNTGPDFSPAGNIYAANQSVLDWTDVACVIFEGDGTPGSDGINVTILEAFYGMSPTAGDGFDETFTTTNSITIGTNTLSDCPATNTFVNNASQTDYFNQTLLTENAESTVIFATHIDPAAIGYDGNPWDFQMIVAENGNEEGTTPYYFYIELV